MSDGPFYGEPAVRLEPRIEDVVAEVGHPWNASYHEHRN